jgi:hypothetical protein
MPIQPYIRRFGHSDFVACAPKVGVDGVLGGGKAAIRRDEDVISESELCAVVDNEVVVRVKVIADAGIIAIVASKGRKKY